MKTPRSTRLTVLSLLLLGCSSAPLVAVFAADDPLDAKHLNPAQKEYWNSKVTRMESKSDGRVTAEGFMKYYSDLWDNNVPAGKTTLTIKELSAKWAAMESQNPLDPEYKTEVWREKHVETMDTDHDGSVSKAEFLAHMQTHWDAASKMAHAPSLSHNEAMDLIMNPLDPRYHVH